MKLLRLATTLNSTSAPYNQFALGLKNRINQTFLSLHSNEISTEASIDCLHANGSVFKMFRVLRAMIAKEKFDVVHIHSGLTGIIFLFAIFPCRIALLSKTVFTIHNSWNVLKTRNQILNFIVMLGVKKICTCGESSYKSIPKIVNFLVGKKIGFITNGFDNHRIDRIERSQSLKDSFSKTAKIKILCVGALNNVKNQAAIIDAFRFVEMDAEIIFLGDGKNKDSLINMSIDLPPSMNVIFKGRVSRDLAIQHMLKADISISLSKGEGLPIAVLESMYAGCFLVLSDIPPHLEISPPSERSIFIDLKNKNEIVDSLNFIQNHIDSIRSSRQLSKEYSINNFSSDIMLSEYMKVYECLRRVHSTGDSR
jgi:glycosyltransferase involved in cell wall biosynthesis